MSETNRSVSQGFPVTGQDPSSSKKRPSDDESHTPNKIPKVHPFFAKKSKPEPSTFQWVEPIGPNRTCLHGMNLSPLSSSKVASFDLDGTLIESTIGTFKRKDATSDLDWNWWNAEVPQRLRKLHEEGFSIVIFSNQAVGVKKVNDLKKKIPLIAAAIPDVPFRIFCATAKDGYRKCMPGMWYELERILNMDDIVIDKSSSFFVGDAAGRSRDFASTDRKFALNVGIHFHTPEEYFLGRNAVSYILPGFNVSCLDKNLPLITPTSTPIIPLKPTPEITLFVGYPGIGKSTFFRKHFEPAGYVHITGPETTTKLAEQAIKEGKRCVIDSTNAALHKRTLYTDLAKRLNVPIRCFFFIGRIELAWHNILYRAYNIPSSAQQPIRWTTYAAFHKDVEDLEEPSSQEGFSEPIKIVNWLFEGDNEERKRWNMWLQIDGR